MTRTTTKEGLTVHGRKQSFTLGFQDNCVLPPLQLAGSLRAFVTSPGVLPPHFSFYDTYQDEPCIKLDEMEAGTTSPVVPPTSRTVRSVPLSRLPLPPRRAPVDFQGFCGAGARVAKDEEAKEEADPMAPPVHVPYDNLRDLFREHGAEAAAAAAAELPRRPSDARGGPLVVVSASNVAAMAGFHPHRELPDLVLQLVYQGSAGRILQKSDAQLLGLEVVDPEMQLRSLARKAGPSAFQAIEKALHVRHQVRRVATASDAAALQLAVEAAVHGATNLTAAEATVLWEGGRHAVFTGFGTFHENSALDRYEKQCGWAVRERNAETRLWDFAASDNDSNHPTAVPLGPSYAKPREPFSTGVDEGSARDDYNNDSRGVAQTASSEPEILPLFRIAGKVDGIRDELVPNHRNHQPSNNGACADDDNNDDADADSWVLRRVVVECKHRIHRLSSTVPFYEEIQAALYCLLFEAEAADLVQVLRRPKKPPSPSSVAARWRVKRPHPSTAPEGPKAANQRRKPPPSPHRTTIPDFFVTRTSAAPTAATGVPPNESAVLGLAATAPPDADRIGVEEDREGARPCPIPTDMSKLSPPAVSSCEKSPPDKPDASDAPAEKDPAVSDKSTEDDDAEVAMRVTRIDLDDPLHQHRRNWSEFVLPRLRSFVDAVYAIRCDDGKRYRLLLHASAAGDPAGRREAWALLHEECPWLAHCDTPFQRLREGAASAAPPDGPPPGTTA